MEASQVFESNGFAVPSPNGRYIASQTGQHLYIQHARSLSVAFIFPISGATSHNPSRPADLSSIQWSHTSQHILLISTQGLRVFSLQNRERKVRISNGSAGLGRIVAADMLGLQQGAEQVMVIWEFGRVAIWDLGTGHAPEELGDVKLGSGKTSEGWAIRREKGKAEVLALLSRHSAQDTLTLFLPPSITPFKTITLPTTDARSIAFHSPWLSVLDSPLSSPAPSTYIYTPDGHLFRSYSTPLPGPLNTNLEEAQQATQDDLTDLTLGPKTLSWSKNHLAIADSISSTITLLSTRTFTASMHLDSITSPPDFCHQELLSAKTTRTYKLLASSSIPIPQDQSWGSVAEMKWNETGSRLAVRYTNSPSTILVWKVPPPNAKKRLDDTRIADAKPPAMILQHDGIRKLTWHPRRDSLLMIISEADTGLYLFDAGVDAPPAFVSHKFTWFATTELGRVNTSWVSAGAQAAGNAETEKVKLLVSSRKKGWFVLYPEGLDENLDDNDEEDLSLGGLNINSTLTDARPDDTSHNAAATAENAVRQGALSREEDEGEFDGNITEDSLYDVLTGRTPLPELGSGKMFARHSTDEAMTGLDDTFREKRARAKMDESVGVEELEALVGSSEDEMF